MTSATSNRRRLDRYIPPGDHFLLISLPNGEERLEPLMNLSAEGIALVLRTQRHDLQPGQLIPRIRFFTGGECTLECRARVRDVTQVSLEDGSVGLKLGLRLELPEGEELEDSETDTYQDIKIINDTLMNIIKTKSRMRFRQDDDQVGLHILRFSPVHADDSTLTVELEEGEILPHRAGKISGELYGASLTLHVQTTTQKGRSLTLMWPTRLEVRRRRIGGRLSRLNHKTVVTFEAPFCRTRLTRQVVDLSARGLAFEAQPTDGLIVGMLLPELTLHLQGALVRNRGVVRNIRLDHADRLLVGVEILHGSKSSARVLQNFVDQNLHPRVRHATLADLRRLWPVYERLELFERVHAALSPLMATVETTRSTLLSRAQSLTIHLVGGHDNELYGNAELIRSYANTLQLQHLGVLPGWQLTPDQLVLPLVETAMRRDDFQQLYAILDPSNSELGLSRLRNTEPDPQHVHWSEFVLFTDPTPESRRFDLSEVQDFTPDDRSWIQELLEQRFTKLQRLTLDLNRTELSLESIRREFQGFGLERKRRVRVLLSPSGPLGCSLIETTSPGANFQGYLDLVRIVPRRKDEAGRREAYRTLARDAVQSQLYQAARRRTLVLVPPDDAWLLSDTEFEQLGSRIEVCASRSGAAQIANFVSLFA